MTEETEEKDYANLPIDLNLASEYALENAQFGFMISPMSIWQAYAPRFNRQTGHCFFQLTSDATKYKNDIHMLAKSQTRREGRAYQWECKQQEYSFWIILKKGHTRCENLDADNCVKLILDAFVSAGLVPDDKHCRDSRVIYGDFAKAGWPDSLAFGVLIRWDQPIIKQGKML